MGQMRQHHALAAEQDSSVQQQQQPGQLEADSHNGQTADEQKSSLHAGGDADDCHSGSDSGSYAGDDDDSSSDAAAADNAAADLPLMPAAPWVPDHTFKVLLIGDSGVGKTCLVMRFISDRFEDQLPSTVGVDFAIKRMVVHDLNIKVTIWDTAGQERFRALTSTFYRGAKGIIFVYDVTRRETLTSLCEGWMSELESYQPHPEVARMVVANKVDQHDRREVSWQEGTDFAKQHGCLFVETSAKQNIAVGVAFEELVLRILDTPSLLAADAEDEPGSTAAVNLGKPADTGGYAVSCSC